MHDKAESNRAGNAGTGLSNTVLYGRGRYSVVAYYTFRAVYDIYKRVDYIRQQRRKNCKNLRKNLEKKER